MIRFGHLDIAFDERVLTPREWTRAQSEWGAELLTTLPEGPVLELCSGAGQIGLLAVALTPRPLVCVDVNPAACDFIRANARRAGLDDLVEVREGDIDQVLPAEERYALVIADPPWVPSAEIGRFPEDPPLAIDGGADGMLVAGLCLTTASRHLLPGGAALLQLGTDSQAVRVAEAVRGTGLRVRETRTVPGGGVLVHLAMELSPPGSRPDGSG